jgi:lipoyl(octanoyl) transferase
MQIVDLEMMAYRQAWKLQEQAHEKVASGAEEILFLVEHPPVITLGRRGDVGGHILKSAEQLTRLGVELVESDRGGDVTFHGPGQLVAYPIVRLLDHQLSVGAYVHRLETITIETLAEWGIEGFTDPKAVGVWVTDGKKRAKICAIGVRIRRGTTLHGLALNVDADLTGFGHIVPCGIAGGAVTSIGKILGKSAPKMPRVKQVLGERIDAAFA